MKWYALFSDGLVHPLGEHKTFDEAAWSIDKYDTHPDLPHPVWIMDAVSLKALDASIQKIKASDL